MGSSSASDSVSPMEKNLSVDCSWSGSVRAKGCTSPLLTRRSSIAWPELDLRAGWVRRFLRSRSSLMRADLEMHRMLENLEEREPNVLENSARISVNCSSPVGFLLEERVTRNPPALRLTT